MPRWCAAAPWFLKSWTVPQSDLTEPRPLEPQRVALEPLACFGHRWSSIHHRLRPGLRSGGGGREEFESASRARKPWRSPTPLSQVSNPSCLSGRGPSLPGMEDSFDLVIKDHL